MLGAGNRFGGDLPDDPVPLGVGTVEELAGSRHASATSESTALSCLVGFLHFPQPCAESELFGTMHASRERMERMVASLMFQLECSNVCAYRERSRRSFR